MKNLLYFIILFICVLACTPHKTVNSFAIVIDEQSYLNARQEVDNYATAIQKDGLNTVLVIDRWHHPDSIKEQLVRLYHNQDSPIEGAVFIGDIPVAMVRDAQHLTTAFKMDQDRYDWSRSSVPTDRFYDDFDLEFDFLRRDSINNGFYYYSLKNTSKQSLRPEIYSGRIKPFETKHKYEDLRRYLSKVVRSKDSLQQANQIMYFGGHGYISESILARMDEKISLLDQFPWLKQQQDGLAYIDHSMDVLVKDRLTSELQRKDLDIAILHHHGADDMQYLNGMPKVSGVTQQIEGIRYYLRSKMRRAKQRNEDLTLLKNRYMNQLGVPSHWFDDMFDQEQVVKDSVFNREMDIHIDDLKCFKPNATIVILDACFNGAFHLDSCMASAYIFNGGNTIAVQANSVNALQDKWANEMLGMVGMGMRVGQWSQCVAYLETHIIGDPTFRFKKQKQKLDIEELLGQKSTSLLLKRFKDASADQKCFILRRLWEVKYADLAELLLSTFKNSSYAVVRMECLKLLTNFNDNNFIECLKLASDDSNEFIRRQATYLIGKSGDPELAETLLKMAMKNNVGARLKFNIKQSLSFYTKGMLLNSIDSVFKADNHFINPQKKKEVLLSNIDYNTNRWTEILETITSSESSLKKKSFSVRMLRNYNYHPHVEGYCDFVLTAKEEELKILMLEALGWFNISCKKSHIIECCNQVIDNQKESDLVRRQAIKTLNRLDANWMR